MHKGATVHAQYMRMWLYEHQILVALCTDNRQVFWLDVIACARLPGIGQWQYGRMLRRYSDEFAGAFPSSLMPRLCGA